MMIGTAAGRRTVVSLRSVLSAIGLLLAAIALTAPVTRADDQLPYPEPKSPSELPETALVQTTKGDFEIEFFRTISPIAVRNFEYLVLKHFYDGITIHRYEPNFVVQMGDPQGNGKGGPGYTIPPEYSKTKHERGTLGMARLPDQVNPERRSSGSQFYITFGSARHLDGLYTVFGRVTKGMEIVDQLRIGDRITKIRLPKNHQPAFQLKDGGKPRKDPGDKAKPAGREG